MQWHGTWGASADIVYDPCDPTWVNPSSCISLFQFMIRQQVLKLYRQILRTVYKIQDDASRKELLEWARHDFRKYKGLQDEVYFSQLMCQLWSTFDDQVQHRPQEKIFVLYDYWYMPYLAACMTLGTIRMPYLGWVLIIFDLNLKLFYIPPLLHMLNVTYCIFLTQEAIKMMLTMGHKHLKELQSAIDLARWWTE